MALSEPPNTGPKIKLTPWSRIMYAITGCMWAIISIFVAVLDWVTGHVLDGLILDFIYVTAGIVAYLQLRAVWRGYTTADLTFRGEYLRVRTHFDSYSTWLFKKLHIIK
jgi:hypothetical protein